MISLVVSVPNNETLSTRSLAFYHASQYRDFCWIEPFVALHRSWKSLGKRRVLRLPCVHDSLKYMNIAAITK